MKKQNSTYVPLNLHTFQERNPEYDWITAYDVHSLRNIEYTEAELDQRDDTMQVVEEIEKLINQCGQILIEKEWPLYGYDENGYLTEEAKKELGDEKEREINLFSMMAVLVRKEDLKIFKGNGGVFDTTDYFGEPRLSYDPVMLQELFASAYKGKAVVKMMVEPKTLEADHFEDMCANGIDVRENFVYGIVDVEKLFAELKKRGIKPSLSTYYPSVEFQKKVHIMIRNGIYNVIKPEPLTDITFESFLQNNINTQFEGEFNASITFGEYLRKRNKQIDDHPTLK